MKCEIYKWNHVVTTSDYFLFYKVGSPTIICCIFKKRKKMNFYTYIINVLLNFDRKWIDFFY